MYEYIKATFQSVFSSDSFMKNPKGMLIINKYGWIFIVIRWSYYSIIFSFRDYHGNWKPFLPPPFGINLDTYAFLQIRFSLLFGFLVMSSMALFLAGYLLLIKKDVSIFKIFNILGVTFFIPFVIVQPIDFLIIFTVGWVDYLIIPIHTIMLIWESFAAANIISNIWRLKLSEKIVSIVLIITIWLVICGILWR